MEGNPTAFAYADDGAQDAADIWDGQRSDLGDCANADYESDDSDDTAESGDDAEGSYDDDDNKNYYDLLCTLAADDDEDGSDMVADVAYGDGSRTLACDGLAAGNEDAACGDWPCSDGDNGDDNDDSAWPLQSYVAPNENRGGASGVWCAATNTLPPDVGDLLPVYDDGDDEDTEGRTIDAHALSHYDPAFDLFYASLLAGISPTQPPSDSVVDDDSVAPACTDTTTPQGVGVPPNTADPCDAERSTPIVHSDSAASTAATRGDPAHGSPHAMATEAVSLAHVPIGQANEPEIEACAHIAGGARSPTPDIAQCTVAADDRADGLNESDSDDSVASARDPSAACEAAHDVALSAEAKDDLGSGVDGDNNVSDDVVVGDGGGIDDDEDRQMIASFDSINIPAQPDLPHAAVAPTVEGVPGPDSGPDSDVCFASADHGDAGDQAPAAGGESPPSQVATAIDLAGTLADTPVSAPVSSADSTVTSSATSTPSASSWWSPWSWWSGKAAPAGTASAASDARLKAPGLVLTKADLDSVKLRPVSERGPRPPVAATPDGVLGQLLGLFGGIAAASASTGAPTNGVDCTRPPSVRALVAAMEGASTPLA
ncbi:hypothetical protein pneo_cds_382 [Pandoravirus neocaledonia]|uniref:Uncharacterized protein n=1 Tax=Pandoravirus neocaledonia TaxID=2107708 RepID=A0A2U7UBZ9_9VIRU|nr:hypothetical protein pneo_cds_382 [Pandoravirus neocaledonia]AVK75989.1 hypothetical protein pneo_cds_382 [Pandoravirus neocaledonia]